jgi:sterol 3beta-glucosyltransferase/vancomycin aglycone glucosyltransferase
VVHHGGSGTTQAALLAGCPSVAVAHAFDQPYWAKTLQQLGAAGKPLHRRSVTAGKIARQIEEVAHSSRIREKARLISASMKEEDGVQHAVRLIEERFSRRRGGRSPQRP